MADQKISQLPTITGANLSDDDKFVLVDTSGDATVATTRAEFFKNTPNIDVTGTVVADDLTVAAGGISQLSNLARIGDNSTFADLTLNSSDSSQGTINFADASDSNIGRIQYNHTDNTMILRAADATRVTVSSSGIDVTGTVGVGLSVPSAFGGQIVSYQSGGASSSAVACVNSATTGTARQIDFFRGASTSRIGSIESTPTSVSYNTSSDYRLKTDAQPMTGASERVQELNPVNFEWISGGSRVDGFLAHEAQEVVPEAVSGERDAMRDEEYEVTPAVLDDDGNVTTEAVMDTHSVPDYQGIDQSKLVPLLTAALQEALTEISSLKSRVEVLEG